MLGHGLAWPGLALLGTSQYSRSMQSSGFFDLSVVLAEVPLRIILHRNRRAMPDHKSRQAGHLLTATTILTPHASASLQGPCETTSNRDPAIRTSKLEGCQQPPLCCLGTQAYYRRCLHNTPSQAQLLHVSPHSSPPHLSLLLEHMENRWRTVLIRLNQDLSLLF